MTGHRPERETLNDLLWRWEELDRRRREYFAWEKVPQELLEELSALRRALDDLGCCL